LQRKTEEIERAEGMEAAAHRTWGVAVGEKAFDPALWTHVEALYMTFHC